MPNILVKDHSVSELSSRQTDS